MSSCEWTFFWHRCSVICVWQLRQKQGNTFPVSGTAPVSGRQRHPLEKAFVAQHQATAVHHQISFETAREAKVDVA